MYSLNRKERSHDTENHCGYLIILDLAKSPFVNTILRQNLAETLTLRLDLSLAKSKTLHEYQPCTVPSEQGKSSLAKPVVSI